MLARPPVALVIKLPMPLALLMLLLLDAAGVELAGGVVTAGVLYQRYKKYSAISTTMAMITFFCVSILYYGC